MFPRLLYKGGIAVISFSFLYRFALFCLFDQGCSHLFEEVACLELSVC